MGNSERNEGSRESSKYVRSTLRTFWARELASAAMEISSVRQAFAAAAPTGCRRNMRPQGGAEWGRGVDLYVAWLTFFTAGKFACFDKYTAGKFGSS